MNFHITDKLDSEDLNLFKALYLNDVAKYYPYSTIITANQFVDNHLTAYDPLGYFSKRKTIWRAYNERLQTLGFTVATEKRGGSIKFGPTIICPQFRNCGLGSNLRLKVEKIYIDRGYRKAYSTTNIKNLPAIFYLTKIGYKIELHLKDHFSFNNDELVLSKRFSIEHLSNNNVDIDLDKLSYVEKILYHNMIADFDGIDNDFFRSLELTIRESISQSETSFINKEKRLFTDGENKFFAIAVPKRGHCVKLSPLIFSNEIKLNKILLESIISYFKPLGFFKYFCIISNTPFNIKMCKALGFYIEGFISEPYKVGSDMLLCSTFISF